MFANGHVYGVNTEINLFPGPNRHLLIPDPLEHDPFL